MEVTPTKKRKAEHEASATKSAIDQIGQGVQVMDVSRYPTSYQNHFTVKLPYSDAFYSSCTYTTGLNWIFRGTSIYDPDYTGGGHQPYQRDSYAAIYGYYAVIQCNYKITVINLSDARTTSLVATAGNEYKPAWLNMCVRKGTTGGDVALVNNAFECRERKGTINKTIAPGRSATISGSLTNGDYNLTAIDEDNDKTWTAVSSNPSVDRFFSVNVNTLAGSGMNQQGTTVFPILIDVELEYVTQFMDYNYRNTWS